MQTERTGLGMSLLVGCRLRSNCWWCSLTASGPRLASCGGWRAARWWGRWQPIHLSATPHRPCVQAECQEFPLFPCTKLRSCRDGGSIQPLGVWSTLTSSVSATSSGHPSKNREIEDIIYVSRNRQNQLMHILQMPSAVADVSLVPWFMDVCILYLPGNWVGSRRHLRICRLITQLSPAWFSVVFLPQGAPALLWGLSTGSPLSIKPRCIVIIIPLCSISMSLMSLLLIYMLIQRALWLFLIVFLAYLPWLIDFKNWNRPYWLDSPQRRRASSY